NKKNGTSKLQQELVKILNKIPISELTWDNPLASQVISYDSKLVHRLSDKQKKKFMKLAEKMVPLTIPSSVYRECNKLAINFSPRNELSLSYGLSHDGTWKESDNKLKEIAVKILDMLRNVWCNPAFGDEFIKSMNEGTYVNNVIVSAIHASLSDNPFGERAFITTFERQSVASADRKGEGRMGRRPDVMFITKEHSKIYELMYAECSKIDCTAKKEKDDRVKLWREANDGMYWVLKSRKPKKDQFGIVGLQVAGLKISLNVLIRDKHEVHRYYKLHESTIPIRYSNDPSVLAEFVKTFLILRNILIVNMYLLRSTPPRRSKRNLENSSTVPSPLR
ncbi:9017_t:CDS:2, partial [Gigaspora rosea]